MYLKSSSYEFAFTHIGFRLGYFVSYENMSNIFFLKKKTCKDVMSRLVTSYYLCCWFIYYYFLLSRNIALEKQNQ